MGARTNFHFKTDTGTLSLYSHWGGDSRKTDLANALNAANPRLGDTSYALRIMISNLVGEDWNSETGFGLTINDMLSTEEEYGTLIVDLTNNTVNDDGNIVSIENFVNYYTNTLVTN